MNIVILSDGAALLGGAEKVAFLSAVELARRGSKVTVFSAVGPVDPMLQGVPNLDVVCLDSTLAKDAEGASQRVRIFGSRIWNRSAAKRFRELLETKDLAETVIHSHGYLAALSASVIDAALDSKAKFVMTMHDYGIACPIRTFYHSRENAICHRHPMGTACLATNCTPASYASKARAIAVQTVHHACGQIVPRLRNVIFVSEFSARILVPFLRKGTEATVLRNPIDAAKLERTEAERQSAVAFVGRLVKEKDPVTLAKAAKLAGVDVVFVGSGPEEEAIRTANPDARITGWLPPSDVHGILRSSRAFVIPSLWYECAPLSTLEAMAHGLPVVTSDANASIDDVEHGETGLVFKAGNVESLVQSLVALSDDAGVRQMSMASYESYWRDPPTIGTHVDALLERYAALRA